MKRLNKSEMVTAPSDLHEGALAVYQYFQGHFCSVCTTGSFSKESVEDMTAAAAEFAVGPWKVVNSEDYGGVGKSPSPCNQVPGRKHWFLASLGSALNR